MARVCDALPNIGYVQSLGSISDVTVGLGDVYEFADHDPEHHQGGDELGLHRRRLSRSAPHRRRHGGRRGGVRQAPNYIHYGEPISPLTSDFHAIDKCIYCAENRIPQVYTPCSIGGGTVPASHAGQIVVGLSEALVGVVTAQLLNPGTCVIVGGVQSILDMRYSVYSYGAPELSILSAGLTELVHYCGLPMFSQSGCTDTKKMELQSGVEAALSINSAMLSGAEFVHDNGYTESGITGSIFQTVLDDEVIGMARVVQGGLEITPETLAVENICNVGPGGHYLYEDHTMKWFRHHWRPTVMDRDSYEDWHSKGRKTMSDRIVEKTRDLIANYEGPASRVPEKANAEIHRILEEAEVRKRKESA